MPDGNHEVSNRAGYVCGGHTRVLFLPSTQAIAETMLDHIRRNTSIARTSIAMLRIPYPRGGIVLPALRSSSYRDFDEKQVDFSKLGLVNFGLQKCYEFLDE